MNSHNNYSWQGPLQHQSVYGRWEYHGLYINLFYIGVQNLAS